MQIKLTTWNINSVRLRMDLIGQFVSMAKPDILCLQETKVEDGKFPLSDVRKLGFDHIAHNGQKGYHGVAIFSRLPFEAIEKRAARGVEPCEACVAGRVRTWTFSTHTASALMRTTMFTMLTASRASS